MTQTLVMTLNLPVTYARIHLILLVGEFFVHLILFTSAELLKAQWSNNGAPVWTNKSILTLRNCSHRESLKTYKNMHIADGLFTLKIT